MGQIWFALWKSVGRGQFKVEAVFYLTEFGNGFVALAILNGRGIWGTGFPTDNLIM